MKAHFACVTQALIQQRLSGQIQTTNGNVHIAFAASVSREQRSFQMAGHRQST
jgi:hypothetical protein